MSKICERCNRLQARPARRYCGQCYRNSAEKRAVVISDSPAIERPEVLKDTGMRIIERTSTLVMPNGLRVPVPAKFSTKYFFEGNDLLRVYAKPCPEKRKLSPTPQPT